MSHRWTHCTASSINPRFISKVVDVPYRHNFGFRDRERMVDAISKEFTCQREYGNAEDHGSRTCKYPHHASHSKTFLISTDTKVVTITLTMNATAPARPYGLDRQRGLLNLDCSADLRPYAGQLGPGVQERIFQTTSDALRKQLDEHRDFLIRHQRQQSHLAPAPVLSGPAAIAPRFYVPPTTQHQPPPPLSQSAAPQPLRTRPSASVVPNDPNAYPAALREALYSRKSISRAHDGRTIYHVMSSSGDGYSEDDTDIVGTCRSMQAANELAARYFVDYLGGPTNEDTYELLANGALHCKVDTGDGHLTVYVQEGRLE
jgi:hypothetical protein